MKTLASSFESPRLETPEQEAAFLRQKLEEKEREITSRKQEKDNPQENHRDIAAREIIEAYKKPTS